MTTRTINGYDVTLRLAGDGLSLASIVNGRRLLKLYVGYTEAEALDDFARHLDRERAAQ